MVFVFHTLEILYIGMLKPPFVNIYTIYYSLYYCNKNATQINYKIQLDFL